LVDNGVEMMLANAVTAGGGGGTVSGSTSSPSLSDSGDLVTLSAAAAAGV